MDASVNAMTCLQLEVEGDGIGLNSQCASFLGAHVAYLLIYWDYWAEVMSGNETL